MGRMGWVRPVHRWASFAFAVVVAAIFAGLAMGGVPEWAYFAPLPLLAVMLPTGLWLFAEPYLRRRGHRARA